MYAVYMTDRNESDLKPKYMSVSQAAEILGVHRNSVHYWIKSGDMAAHRKGLAEKSPYLISAAEVERVKCLLTPHQ